MKRWELESKYADAERTIAAQRVDIATLLAKLAEAMARVEALTTRVAELEEAQRAANRQAGRFRRRESQRVNEPKPRGRKAGEGKWSRRAEPTEEEKAAASTKSSTLGPQCPHCQGELVDLQPYECFELDIPATRPVLTRFEGESGYCAACGKRHYSMHPLQTSTATGAAAVSIGPLAKALASDMKHHLGLSYGKIKDFFAVAFGLSVTRSALYASDMKLAARAGPVYEELIQLIRQSLYVNVDETGWRIGILSAWLWVFTSTEVTVYTTRRSRGHEVVLEILGKRFQGILVSDGALAYDAKALSDWLKQKCLAHILRTLSALSVSTRQSHVALAAAAIPVLRDALALSRQRDTLDAEAYLAQSAAIEARLDTVLSEHTTDAQDDDGARMVKHMKKHREHLLRFLYVDGLPATNNAAEQGLRPAVITRKTTGCDRTAQGADAHATLASLGATLRKRGIPVIDFLIALQRPNPPTLAAAIATANTTQR